MESVTKQALRIAENLSLPTFQVVVMNANMSCHHCRQRASKIVSKMNGLIDYVVDISNKQVVVRGGLMSSDNSKKQKLVDANKNFPLISCLFRLLRPACFNA